MLFLEMNQIFYEKLLLEIFKLKVIFRIITNFLLHSRH